MKKSKPRLKWLSGTISRIVVKRQTLKIWVDLENSPHVLFFEPVIRELESLGHTVVTTARNFCNTLALVQAKNLPAKTIGVGCERSRTEILKWSYWFFRMLQLRQFARDQSFDVAVSHGSRTQAVAAQHLGIPTFITQDYEYQDLKAFSHAKCFMIPDMVPRAPFEKAGIAPEVIHRYQGLKENVYLTGFRQSVDVRAELGIPHDEILVSFRPASDTAHYLRNSGLGIQDILMDRLLSLDGVRVLVLPRTERQRKFFEAKFTGRQAFQVCRDVIDGPSLIYASDLVVSGGGTMVREAAALGVPAVSCFAGRLGAVDQTLARERKLAVIRNLEDVYRLQPVKRIPRLPQALENSPLPVIIEGICDAAE